MKKKKNTKRKNIIKNIVNFDNSYTYDQHREKYKKKKKKKSFTSLLSSLKGDVS